MVTSVSWTVNADGDWATAANWSNGMVPNSSNNVTISTSNVHTITHDSGNDTVNSLTVGNDIFVLGGGSLDILANASFADTYDQFGGVLSAGTVTLHRAVLAGGSSTGTTTINALGTTALANYTFAGSTIFDNSKNTNQTGQITVGDATGTNAMIDNAVSGTYDIAGDYGINNGAASAAFDNAGLLAKTNGSGTSDVGIDIVSTGTIAAAAGGTLEFDGPNNIISGVVTGPGAITFGGSGKTTLTSGTITVASLQVIDGASLTLGTNTMLTGVLTEAASFGSADINVGANTLTIAGAGSSVSGFEGGSTINGTGELANTGSLTLGELTLGGAVTLGNTGIITQNGTVTIGDGSGALARISNAAGGVYDFVQDVSLGIGANTGAAFSNAGTLEKTTSTGASNISAAVSNLAGATITAATGTLTFSNTLNNAGTIAGAGHVQLVNSAQADFAAGTALTVAELDVTDGATLTLGTSLSYAGVFTEEANFGSALINLGANTLTLSGANNVINGFEGSSTINGSGVLANTGTLSVGELTLGGTDKLINSGLVNEAGTLTIGDGAGNTAIVDNAAHATWNLVNTSGFLEGASSLSTFENFGLLDATPGSGNTVNLTASIDNEKGGTVTAGSGVLDISGGLLNDGVISGGTLQLINSATGNFSSGTVLGSTELDVLGNATLTLGTSLTYKGAFTDGANFGSATINLATHNLTLSGPVTFTAFEGGDRLTGSGTLTISGTTQLAGLTIGATATYSNTGTIHADGNLTVGDGSGNAASFVNGTKGIYDLVNDSGIGVGASMASAFVNNGLFEKTAGTGTSVVSSPFVNNGTLTVTSGTVEFLAGTFVNHGTVNGVETTDNSGNIYITHS